MMENEKPTTNELIYQGIRSGVIFAVILAGFDYINNESFSIYKILLFGIFVGLVTIIDKKYFSKK